MEASVTLRFVTHTLSLFPHTPISSISVFPKFSSHTTLSVAKKKSSIEGVSEELNAMVSQNLDFAPSRRPVRAAFTEVHQQFDHFLFKAGYNVISYDRPTRLKTGMELLSATQEIESQLRKVSAPLLILHGAADQVTDPLVSQFLYEKASSKDKTLKFYEGSYHGILEGEPDDRILAVHNDIISWLDFRCSL